MTDIVVLDQNIITSQGPATAIAFSLKIIEELKGKEASDKVSAGLLYPKLFESAGSST